MSAFHPLQTFQSPRYWIGMATQSDDDDLDTYWSVQPRWVRVLTYAVALPAWLWWIGQILVGASLDRWSLLPFYLFAGVGLIQLGIAARAFWRLDL